VLSYEEVLSRGRSAPVPVAEVAPEALATFTYTSGTTGKPKGVMLSHFNIASNVGAVVAAFGMDPAGERSLAFLPWAHVYGQVVELYSALVAGSQVYLAESPTTLLQNLAEAQPTVLFSVPRVWNKVYAGIHGKMLQEGGAKLALFRRALAVAKQKAELAALGRSSAWVDLQVRVLDALVFSKIRARLGGRLKYAVSGAASLSPEVARFFSYVGLTVLEGYGLTETSPVATNNRPGANRLGSVGRALPGVTIRIHPVEGIPAGEGEVVVQGPNVMQGYYKRPEETAAVFLPDGAFRTGDLGRMDADGFVYITGRVKEQFKLENGKYVSPAPLEEALKVSPYVAQVFLDGANRPHVVALVVPNAEALLAWAKHHGLEGKTVPQLIGEPAVRGFYRAELDRLSTGFKGYERVAEFTLIPEEFTADNGLLTPSLKVKRAAVAQRYRGHLEALYAEPAAA
jgi:long-chain acyl-CoA synthetase